MIPIYVNGLFPGRDDGFGDDNGGTRVAIIDIEAKRNDLRRQILQRFANTDGAIEAEIANDFIGKQLKVVIRDAGFKVLEGIETVQSYGLVYTARLEIDRAYEGTHNNPEAFASWSSEQRYSVAQDAAHNKVREFRHQNRIAIGFHIIVAFVSAFLGLYISGLWGVLGCLVAALILEFTAPYSAGIEPFRLTRRSTGTRQKRGAP